MSKRSISHSSEETDTTDSDGGASECEDSKVDFICALRNNDYARVVHLLSSVTPAIAVKLVNCKDFNSRAADRPLHILVKSLIKNKNDNNYKNTQASRDIIELLVRNRASGNYVNAKKISALELVRNQLPEDIELQKLFAPDDSLNVANSSQASKRSFAISDFINADSEKQKKPKRSVATYAASGLKYSLHGTIFQLQLLMLYTHRGVANFKIFDLATEMDQADKFDDVVVRFKNESDDNWHWSFLQAKHKNNPQTDRVALKDFIAIDSGPFSITKYFISFCRIAANPTFKDGKFDDFILCTNTSLNLAKHKREREEASLGAKKQSANDLVDKWEKHLTCSGLSDKCILFCHNNTSDTQVYRFNSNSYDDVSALLKSAFIEKCKSCVFLTDLQHIGNVLNLLQRQPVLKNALACIKLFESAAKQNLKTSIKANAKKILNFSKILEDLDFKELEMALKAYQNHKGKSDQLNRAVCGAINNLKQEITVAADKGNIVVDSLKDTSSSRCSEVNDDVKKLINLTKIATVLRADIFKCTKVEELESQLKNGIEQWNSLGICVPPTLSELACKVGNLELADGQHQCQNRLEALLGEMIMIEMSCRPWKFELYLKEFLEKFQFIVNYPDVAQLNIILKTEFGEQFCLLDADLLSDSFERHILQWFMEYNNGRSTLLSSDQGHSFYESLRQSLVSLMTSGLNKAYLDKLHSYHISFRETNDSFKKFLLSDKRILLISAHSTRLSTMKVLQTVREIDCFAYQDSFICVRLKSLFTTQVRKMVCDAFSIENKFFLVVVECQGGSLSDIGFRYACEGLLTSLKQLKKIVFISSDTSDFVWRELKALTSWEICQLQDKTEFSDLNKTSQTALLDRPLLLQNETATLGHLLDVESATAVIDEQVLQCLVEQKKIEIGDAKAFFSPGYDATCYIERGLHHQKLTIQVFSVQNAIFLATGMTKQAFSSLRISNALCDFQRGNAYEAGSIIFPPSAELEGARIFNDLVLVHHNPRSRLEVIWIECQKMDFYWQAHTGGVADINRYVNQHKEFGPKNEQTFAHLNSKQKIVIVASDPGMGKSTYITSLSRKMKTAHSDLWIARINLNDHAFQRQRLSDIDNRKFTKSLNELPAVVDSDFICDMALWSDMGRGLEMFQRRLFKLGIDGHERAVTPKIVIFFDGFDEICPTYEKHVIQILRMLESSAVAQIWITTRMQEKAFLEDTLLRPAHVLSNLTKDDQIGFLSKYWPLKLISNVKDLLKMEDCTAVVLYLHTSASNILKHVEDDQGVFNKMMHVSPDDFKDSCSFDVEECHFKPVASFFVDQWDNVIRDSQQSLIDIPLQLNMLGQIVIDQNFKLPVNIGLTSLFHMFVQSKMNIYFYGKSVFVSSVLSDEISEDQSKVLRQDLSILALNVLFPDGNWPRPVRTPSLLARSGLLILYSESHFQFIHRSFADYFVADLLVKKLKVEDFQSLLLKTIFINDGFYLICAFLDEMLMQYPNQDVELSRPLLEEISKSKYSRDTFLHSIVYMGYPNIMKYLIEKIFVYPDIFDTLLLKAGTYGTIPLYATIYSPGHHQAKMNYSGNPKSQTVKTFLSLLQNEQVTKILTHFHEELLIILHNQVREVTMLHVALLVRDEDDTVAKTLIEQIVTRGLLKDVFGNNGYAKDGTIFHFCSRVKWAGFMNVLHMVTDMSAGEKTHLENLRELLLWKDSSGRTPLHWLAVAPSRAGTLSEFLDWLLLHTEDAKINTILDYLECEDKQGLTAVEISVYRNNTEVTGIFLEFLEKHCPRKYDELFTRPSHQSLLHKSISQGKTESVTTLIARWIKRLPFFEFKHHLLHPFSDTDRRTSLTLAAARKFHTTVQTVFSSLEEHLHEDDFNICVPELMECRGQEGRNLLHESIYWKCSKVVDVLLHLIDSKCDLKIRLSVLFSADDHGKIPFDRSSDLEYDTYQTLFKTYETVIAQIWSDDLGPLIDYFNLENVTFIEKFLEAHYTHRMELPAVLSRAKLRRAPTASRGKTAVGLLPG